MGDIYKQVGGWKGIRKDILEPLAKYQKSQGMDTSFTRLYDAYNKVDPIWQKVDTIWQKMHPDEKKDPPRVGMGDLRVAEAAMGNGAAGSGGSKGFADVGVGGMINGNNSFLPKADSGFAPNDYHRQLTRRLRRYFRRPFDRWDEDDGGDDSLYLDRFDKDEPLYDLTQWQQFGPLLSAQEEPKAESLPDFFRDEKQNYHQLSWRRRR